MALNAQLFLPRSRFDDLLAALRQAGYRCVGPRVRDGAILYEDIASTNELPQGIVDHQAPGEYRLRETSTPRFFAWANGPQALKPHLFAARETLWQGRRSEDGRIRFTPTVPKEPPLAVIGVRSCDIAGLAIHDQHFLHGGARDAHYEARRREMFLVAVHCAHPAATCFCASTGDGPRAETGFDLALGELDEGFVVESGTDRGAALIATLQLPAATAGQIAEVAGEVRAAAEGQQRRMVSKDLRDTLYGNLQHPRWDDVAARCLSCANCTLVCPTCFCHAESEAPALDGTQTEHYREWSSCFKEDHSYIHGHVIRGPTRERYRQWLTHKLGGWHDQFGRSGCVGCGRCITWCPTGIDITEEAAAIWGAQGDG